MKPSLDASNRVRRPWKQGIDTAIPWEARTYCFRVKDGVVGVVHEKWIVGRDMSGSATQYTKVAGPPLSDLDSPKLTYAQVEAIFRDAEATDDPLCVSYGRVVSLDNLTAAQLEGLATCPQIYVSMPQVAVTQTADEMQSKVDAYKATVTKASTEAPVRKVRAHIPPQ